MEELIHQLGVEWKLLIAQIINFVILLFVLKKFLYAPLVKFMNMRKEKIVSGLEKAEQAEQAFEKLQEQKEQELAKIHKQAQSIIAKAKETGDQKQQEIIAATEKRAQKIIDDAKSQIQAEKEVMIKQVRSDIADLIAGATSKILEQEMTEQKQKDLTQKTLKVLKDTT
ncbi:F0F1 ATP synthase subunit B [Patescibacteria group bacterium AH-259-L05]|nr:F0F1 ATP synthase subunit B [Patescibacteria group bacterium AH-259-L05]